MLTATLPVTAKERDRRVTYRPGDGTCPEDGTLTVSETTGVKKVRTVVRHYAVEEEYAVGFAGRVFMLAKLVHAGDLDTAKGLAGAARTGEVYRVALAPNGFASCSCKAGSTGGPRCSHREALKAVAAAGLAVLPNPYESGCDRACDSREYDDQPEPAWAAAGGDDL